MSLKDTSSEDWEMLYENWRKSGVSQRDRFPHTISLLIKEFDLNRRFELFKFRMTLSNLFWQ
jgi:hypothetical protein